MPRCPSCFTPMTRAEEEGIKSSVCGNCFGTWMAMVALQRRTRADLSLVNKPLPEGEAPSDGDIRGSNLGELAEMVQASDTKQNLRCPQCEKLMVKDRFHAMIPVTIDRCKPCGTLWLDAGKLSLLRRLHFEMMSTTDPEIIRRRDKITTVTAAWESRTTAAESVRQAVNGAVSPNAETAFDILAHLLRSS